MDPRLYRWLAFSMKDHAFSCLRLNVLVFHGRCPARFSKAVLAFLDALAWLNQHYERQNDVKSWRLKPKSHYLAELGRIGCNPSNSWTYKDESFGGFAAELSKRRGGAFTMLSVSRHLLSQYCAMQSFPRAGQPQGSAFV